MMTFTTQALEGRIMNQILVVEDDLHMRENIQELLLMNEYECISANDGIEALEKLKYNKVDLIISDLMMPNLDGIGFLNLYKQIHPILLLRLFF